MADCSYVRCVQERKFIKRKLQKWTKSMVYIVGKFYNHSIYLFIKKTKNWFFPKKKRKWTCCQNVTRPFPLTPARLGHV